MLLPLWPCRSLSFFFFNDTATTEIYTLSLHDALPIYRGAQPARRLEEYARYPLFRTVGIDSAYYEPPEEPRSEEHTSELQSRLHLVCRLLLEKKKKKRKMGY